MIEDKNVNLQIFGGILKKPSILSEVDKYFLTPNDFHSSFEKKLFGIIYNLYHQGVTNISVLDIETYLQDIPSALSCWQSEHGEDYIIDAIELSNLENFDYYYQKLKKINALRELKKRGYNISHFYIEDPADPNYQKINQQFEQISVNDIFNYFKKDINEIYNNLGANEENKVSSAAHNIQNLIDNYTMTPDVGPRLQGEIFNTVVRGARKGKYYLRSAASGVGKTRRMVGDCCYLAYPIRFNFSSQDWAWDGAKEKVLLIVTEQDIDEIQTMILAYLSGINEDKILFNNYNGEEKERLQIALEIMNIYQDNFIICRMPNPNIEQIQNVIRTQVLEKQINYIFYDYIFSNPALLNEFRDLKIRDDQALGLLSAALKDLATELDVFILSSTQLNANGEDTNKPIKNEGSIRGSRAIVDKVDMGCIVSRPQLEELRVISSLTTTPPNSVTDVYKMRRGRYTHVKIWSYIDLGTCRVEDLLITDINLTPIPIHPIKQQYPEEQWDIIKLLLKFNKKEDNVEDKSSNEARSISKNLFEGLM